MPYFRRTVVEKDYLGFYRKRLRVVAFRILNVVKQLRTPHFFDEILIFSQNRHFILLNPKMREIGRPYLFAVSKCNWMKLKPAIAFP